FGYDIIPEIREFSVIPGLWIPKCYGRKRFFLFRREQPKVDLLGKCSRWFQSRIFQRWRPIRLMDIVKIMWQIIFIQWQLISGRFSDRYNPLFFHGTLVVALSVTYPHLPPIRYRYIRYALLRGIQP